MREIITVSVGQAGNQIGWRFWDVLVREHVASGHNGGSGGDALSSFFRSAEGGFRIAGLPTGVRARTVLVDMEEGVVAQMQRSSIRGLFDSSSSVTDVSGAGNNWAHGYAVCGPHHRSAIVDRIRLALEACESPQAFFLTHSLGGGTGSGVGSYILEALADEFPEPYRITASLFPSDNDDVITSPYNALLATSRLVDSADCVFAIENQALLDVMAAASRGEKNESASSSNGSSATATTTTVDNLLLTSSASAVISRSSPSSFNATNATTTTTQIERSTEIQPSAALRSILEAADDLLAASANSSALPTSTSILKGKVGVPKIAAKQSTSIRPGGAKTMAPKTAVPTRGGSGVRGRVVAPIVKDSVALRLAANAQGVGRAAVRTETNIMNRSEVTMPAISATVVDTREKPRVESLSTSSSPSPPPSLPPPHSPLLYSERHADTCAPPLTIETRSVAASQPPPQSRSGTSWDGMNEFVARLLSDVTAGMRFPGSLNLDLNEIASTLVPFPRMHFLSTRLVFLSFSFSAAFILYGTITPFPFHPLPPPLPLV